MKRGRLITFVQRMYDFYARAWTPAILSDYAEAIEDLSDNEINSAWINVRKGQRMWVPPTPAEFREAINVKVDETPCATCDGARYVPTEGRAMRPCPACRANSHKESL